MLSSLNDEGVEFLVVGAYALAAHGYPRATGDIDIWVRPNPENARRVLRALAQCGAPLSSLSEQDFTTPNMVGQFGIVPCRRDILTSITAVEFGAAWANKVAVEIDGLRIHVLSKADLLTNKLAAGRDKDKGDAGWLKKSLAEES
ncbi:MAG: DUF6036 family nucleotidyltransferase [Pyrinomonadaceae bacterium]